MRVALYPRVSGHEQEDNYSIPEQIDRMKKYCAARDWMVYKIYTDSGFSGSNLERPGLQQLIKDAENKKIDMVLVYKLDRLSRSQKDTLYLIEDVFDKHGVFFSSMTENFDTSTPFGKAILGILAVFAQLEREQIKERTMVGKDSRAKEGLWHGSAQVPTGYDYIDGKLVINEYEAMQIREAADLFLKMTPVRTIARIFNAKGYLRKGNDWEAKNVNGVLTSATTYGKIKNRDKEYDGQHTAILPESVRGKINAIAEERKDKWGNSRRDGQKSLLGGIIYCKHCGAKYARQNNGKGTIYYSCYSRCKAVPRMVKDPNCKNKNYRAVDLDGFVIGEIAKLAVEPGRIQEVREKRPDNSVQDKVKAINGEIAKIDTQISKLMDLYAIGHIDISVISEKVGALNGQKTALEKEVASIEMPDSGDVMTDEQIRDMAALLNDDLPLEEKRRIVQTLIYYIEIDNENIFIHWRF